MLKIKLKDTKSSISSRPLGQIVECPECNAMITVKNAHRNTERICWRCLKAVSVSLAK